MTNDIIVEKKIKQPQKRAYWFYQLYNLEKNIGQHFKSIRKSSLMYCL